MAESVIVTVADLDRALTASRSDSDAVQRMVLQRIQQRLDELDLQLVDGELLLRDEITDQIVEDGCVQTKIRQMTTEVALSGDTGISFNLDSLFVPIDLSLRVAAQVDARGRAQQIFGFRLGSCREIASDSFDFSAVGPLDISLTLSVALNPVWIDDSTLRVTPAVSVSGELRESDIRVDVDDSLLRAALERFLQEKVDDLFGADRLAEELADLQTSLNERLQDDQGEDSSSIDIVLPPATDDQIVGLYELLTPQARFPLTTEFLQANRLQILAALIFDDQERIAELLENAAFCELTSTLQVDLPVVQTYEWRDGICATADLTQSGTKYGDNSCRIAFEYYPTNFSEFCRVSLVSDRLGNAQSNAGELQRWSLSPGTTFELGTLPVEGKFQPFVQRENYKNVPNDIGNCALEMRIYKDTPLSQNNKVMIALHGGSWQNRGTGFLGVENMATHFVNQGFVVFAPFYRLIHDSDGSPECHNSSLDELLSDVIDAFDWVVTNSEAYGATGKPLVFGQSAGGHLAAYLAVNAPAQVERAVLFYAPTDFADFGQQINNGDYTNETGIKIMQRVTGSEEFDLQSPIAREIVRENSFPAIVESQTEIYPPMFLLHGESDSLLPSRQSVRMCNGLAGSVENGPVAYDGTGETRRSYTCDSKGSQLHLIAEGEHTLDLCLSDELCLAGSPASAAVTADSIEQMLQWSASDNLDESLPAGSRSGGGTFSSSGYLLFFLLCVKARFGRLSPRLRLSHRY